MSAPGDAAAARGRSVDADGALFAALWAALDTALFRVDDPAGPDPAARLLGEAPAWLRDEPGAAGISGLRSALASGPVPLSLLEERFPLLGVFFFDAEAVWIAPPGGGRAPVAVVRSEPWTQTEDGAAAPAEELVLEASALRVRVGGAGEPVCLLLIARAGAAFEQRRRLQQVANQSSLDLHERAKLAEAMRAARDAAREASQVKSRFLANMSHELRTPLNAIVLYNDLLRDEAEDRGLTQMLADLDKVRHAAEHLLQLINSVLDLSKVEAGKMEVHPEEFALGPLLRATLDTLRPLALKNRNTLALDAPPPDRDHELGAVRTDLLKLRQMLFNLLSNACKFTTAGTITLAARRRGDELILGVRDSGIGMTPEQLARVFTPFTQADSSTQRRFGGTGLGLSLVKSFAELLGGRVDAESAPGRGTCFTLTLPAMYHAPAPSTPPAPPGPSAAPEGAAPASPMPDPE